MRFIACIKKSTLKVLIVFSEPEDKIPLKPYNDLSPSSMSHRRGNPVTFTLVLTEFIRTWTTSLFPLLPRRYCRGVHLENLDSQPDFTGIPHHFGVTGKTMMINKADWRGIKPKCNCEKLFGWRLDILGRNSSRADWKNGDFCLWWSGFPCSTSPGNAVPIFILEFVGFESPRVIRDLSAL